MLSHSLNDTSTNIKSGHDNLKSFITNYRDSSFKTMKEVNIFSFQIINTKMTLIKYSVKSPTTWKVIECRSVSLPLRFSDVHQYIKVFELFAFLLNDIGKQKKIFKQLELEDLGIISIPEEDTVGSHLL